MALENIQRWIFLSLNCADNKLLKTILKYNKHIEFKWAILTFNAVLPDILKGVNKKKHVEATECTKRSLNLVRGVLQLLCKQQIPDLRCSVDSLYYIANK